MTTARRLTGYAAAIAATLLAFPAGALAQPGQTYRPSRDREKEQRDDKPQRDLQEEGRELFRPGGAGGAGGSRKEAEGGASWSIVLLAFRGEMQQQDAMRGLGIVQTEWGLPDAYVEKRGEATVVAFGRYQDPKHPSAQADLKRIRAIEVEIDRQKERPFEFAFLTPPESIPGSVPEFDLRNVQKIHGNWALYTLQIGIYRREDGHPSPAQIAEFRKLAEDAVLQLRREGEQAFYYHGPTGSTVTIGMFGIEDFDPQIRLESPRLRKLREQYPHNLLNGMGIKRRVKVTDQSGRQVQTERLDPSMLVAVPKAERR